MTTKIARGACAICRYMPGTPVMLTISIIFALLVLLWGRIGITHSGR